MKKIKINTKKFVLKNFQKKLINKNYLSWFKNKKDYKYIVNSTSKMNLDSLKNYVDKNLKNSKVIFLSINLKKNNKHIGNVRLMYGKNRSMKFSIMLGDAKYRNKGLGSEVLNICSNYVFRKLKRKMLSAEVILNNKSAVRIYEKCGFKITKAYFKKFKNIKTKFLLMTKSKEENEGEEHIAFVPARKGSVGFKDKNLILFKYTGEFLKKNELFSKKFVSTNDSRVEKISKKYHFHVHKRSDLLSGNKVSIKKTLKNFIKEKNISKESIIWLFYIPIIYKRKKDFINAKKITLYKNFKSLCSFKKIDNSPFNSWYKKKGKMFQFIKNDYFRRQDLPETFTHYHYLCAFKAKYIDLLNSELVCSDTIPIILNKNTSSNLIEIDSSHDYVLWKKNEKKYKKLK